MLDESSVRAEQRQELLHDVVERPRLGCVEEDPSAEELLGQDQREALAGSDLGGSEVRSQRLISFGIPLGVSRSKKTVAPRALGTT